LAKLIKHQNPKVANNAFSSLLGIRHDDPEVQLVLTGVLEHEDALFRELSFQTLKAARPTHVKVFLKALQIETPESLRLIADLLADSEARNQLSQNFSQALEENDARHN
jgi:hypothetical protein